MHDLEFTIEPFVEGHPGPHVVAAVDAVRALGIAVEFGPFGSTCTVSSALAADAVAALTRAALSHGATHVSVHVGPASDGERA